MYIGHAQVLPTWRRITIRANNNDQLFNLLFSNADNHVCWTWQINVLLQQPLHFYLSSSWDFYNLLFLSLFLALKYSSLDCLTLTAVTVTTSILAPPNSVTTHISVVLLAWLRYTHKQYFTQRPDALKWKQRLLSNDCSNIKPGRNDLPERVYLTEESNNKTI